jgi:hypothetical protein
MSSEDVANSASKRKRACVIQTEMQQAASKKLGSITSNGKVVASLVNGYDDTDEDDDADDEFVPDSDDVDSTSDSGSEEPSEQDEGDVEEENISTCENGNALNKVSETKQPK